MVLGVLSPTLLSPGLPHRDDPLWSLPLTQEPPGCFWAMSLLRGQSTIVQWLPIYVCGLTNGAGGAAGPSARDHASFNLPTHAFPQEPLMASFPLED